MAVMKELMSEREFQSFLHSIVDTVSAAQFKHSLLKHGQAFMKIEGIAVKAFENYNSSTGDLTYTVEM